MVCPLETSPPKENSIAWLRRLDDALELNTNSAGDLEEQSSLRYQMPNTCSTHTICSHCCPANLSKRGLALWEPLHRYCPWQSWGGRGDIQRMKTTTVHHKAAAGLKPIPGETGVWGRGTGRPREVFKEPQKSCKYGQPWGLNGVSLERSSGRF